MPSLRQQFALAIAKGLTRKGIDKASKWAEKYRMMGNPHPGPWRFKRHPWLLEMHDTSERKIVGQKAAQMGYTEWAMNMAFYHMDVKGQDVLYVLPTSDDASDFTSARFDPALENSEHLKNFFGDVNNVGLKRAGTNILYVRGSKSRSKLKSIPAPIMIWDEVDEMPPASLALGEERQSGQDDYRTMMLSTPSLANTGINTEFEYSTKDRYHFVCPCCSRLTELVFPDCLVITGDKVTDPEVKNSHLICKECKGVLPNETKQDWLKPVAHGGTGRFVAEYPGREVRGFHVSQLYSMAAKCAPDKIAEAALKAQYDETRAQELWNSKLGLCYAAEGSKVTEEHLAALIRDYVMGPNLLENKYTTLGCDIGAKNNVVIKEWTPDVNWRPGYAVNDCWRPRTIKVHKTSGDVDDFDEVLQLFDEYGCHAAVVDAEPERRAASQFARKRPGKIYLCDYSTGQASRSLSIIEDEMLMKANRTAWLDLTLGRYKAGTIDLPKDLSQEFKNHICEPTRVLQEDKWGNPYATYKNAGPDHYAHADNYAELALPVAIGTSGQNQNITDLT
jgi:phage terminase large subunit GpA-like protein|tara:strand:- start:109 stop:1791 length:1683 start_codon:yes stop_codon:yes gene_type:complete